jgi:hypothetical protein
LRNIILGLFEFLFGCWHRHMCFPRTPKPGQRRIPAAFWSGTYVVCLDCGKEFAYDWDQLRILPEREYNRKTADTLEARSHT